MSMRNIRKLYGGNNTLPPPENDSDGEYVPLYANCSPSKYKYQGLDLSSNSESEQAASNSDDEEVEEVVVEVEQKKKKKNNKKKKKNKQQRNKQRHGSGSKENDELDEIDISVMEVNALLGSPPPAPIRFEDIYGDPAVALLSVQSKHLNVVNELNRLFGPDEEEGRRRRGRHIPMLRLLRRAVIVPMSENVAHFQKVGLSMTLQRNGYDGVAYFTFDHSVEYQRMHRAFLQLTNSPHNHVVPAEDALRNWHVEGMLESVDSMFRLEEYYTANALLEQTIAYMHFVAHPSFILTNGKNRLEYRFMENRPFHIAVLKYLHLLTNRACHRTALELAKLLLSLDPSDPLAVLFIVDTLALRAREHKWLIDAVDYWSNERDAGFMFNILFSYAMAHFHVAKKNKGSLAHADMLLQNAMMQYPSVVMNILDCANIKPSDRLLYNPIFNSTISKECFQMGNNLRELILLYAKLTHAKWREPPVYDWLMRNANQLIDQFNDDPLVMQERAKGLLNVRLNLFRGWPEQITRHLSIIRPMANLLVDGAVPPMNRTRPSDPVPPITGVNRYGYDRVLATNVTVVSGLYELISSILPHYELAVPPGHNMYMNNQQFQEQLAFAVLRDVRVNAIELQDLADELSEEERENEDAAP